MTIRQLRLISISYLMLPNLLFFHFWTGQLIGVLGLGICASILFYEFRDSAFSGEVIFNANDLSKIALCSVMFCLLSGVCGVFYQTNDHWAHNTKFFELFKYDWPIRIPTGGPVVGYYYGYYLVPALFSKMAGYFSESAIFVWTVLGMALGICWLYTSVGQKLRYVLLVLMVGDFAHVCNSLFSKLFRYPYSFGDFGIEVWSNFENLFWVPNQIIPSMIVGGMLVHCIRSEIAPERMVLPICLSFWWAVFPAFASSILVAILIIKKWISRSLPTSAPEFTCTILLPCICVVPVLLLFLSHERPAVVGFIWDFADRSNSRILEYVLNVGVNATVLAFLFRYFSVNDRNQASAFPFYVAVCLILTMPLVRIGKVNDFLFRGFMPLLVVAGLCIYQYLPNRGFNRRFSSVKRAGFAFLICFLVVGPSFLAIGRVIRASEFNRITARIFPGRVHFEPVPYDFYPNVYEALRARWSQAEADQYLGKKNSIYERLIAPE